MREGGRVAALFSCLDGRHSSGDPAGTIAAFDQDTGILSIDLAGGGSVSGLVTDDTKIGTSGKCDHDHGSDDRRSLMRHRRHHRDGGEHGRHGWDSGSTDDLTPGAVVDDAVLLLEDGRAVFVKVDLTG